MKTIRWILSAGLLLAFILSLAACSWKKPNDADAFALKPDACLGALAWGMSKDEIKALLGSQYTLTDYSAFGEEDSFMIKEIRFLGERADAIYTFAWPEAEPYGGLPGTRRRPGRTHPVGGWRRSGRRRSGASRP